MKRHNQHVVPHNDTWAVRGERNSKVTAVRTTQQQAISLARNIAINNRSEVVIHGRDGRIRDKDSYGKDSNPPRDQKH